MMQKKITFLEITTVYSFQQILFFGNIEFLYLLDYCPLIYRDYKKLLCIADIK